MLSLLQNSQEVALISAAFLGLCVGSFLNVVIHRLPIMMEREWRAQCQELDSSSAEALANATGTPAIEQAAPERFNLVVPRSRCPDCGHAIGALENIPVLSYLLQRGRCRGCGTRISPRYPLVELLTAILTVAVVARFGLTLAGAGVVLLTFALVALTFIDLDTMLLPDSITLPLLWLGLGLNLVPVYASLPDAVIGAMAGYLSLWAIYWAFKLLTGKEGMGYGDFKLLAALGAWLGWSALPTVVLLSSIVGAAVGVTMILLRGHDRQIPIPFGPYIAAAGWLAAMWGEDIAALYLGTLAGTG
jgi:leader peptidase (prepilin peptidase)/N-methyltransferase